jgi:K+-sensing histidine kinase KdpD
MFHAIATFESQMSQIEDFQSMNRLLFNSLKRILPLKSINVFFFGESELNLIPVEEDCLEFVKTFVNNAYKEGILDWIFEAGKVSLIPLPENHRATGSKFNFLILPLLEGEKKKGVIAILTPLTSINPEDLDIQVINLMIGMALSKIEALYAKAKLKTTLNELQTYQAKLANDFKLSAIGELTDGIVEDIVDPLQVILSFVDLSGLNSIEKSSADLIKTQVQKIERVIARLVKFANIDSDNIKIEPCYVNNIIRDYINLVKSFLESVNIECILDLEKDIPPVLSHPNYIYQLLTNIFSMIKTYSPKGGGILIQSRFVDEHVSVKVITTSFLQNISETNSENVKTRDLNLNIINDLMKKHEGELRAAADNQKGSAIILNFPLKRKIRK